MEANDYCSYELSLALKKHGFDLEVNHVYDKNGELWEEGMNENADCNCTAYFDYNKSGYIEVSASAPTLAQAQKWLRERKKLHCQVLLNGVRTMYFWQIRELVGNGKHAESKHQYEIYEDAMNDCIAAALELIEKKGE